MLDENGVPLGMPTQVSDGNGPANEPRIVWLGERYAVAWWATIDAVDRVFLATLSNSGVVEGEIRLGVEGAPADDVTMAVSDGRLALVWEDERDGAAGFYFALVAPQTLMIELEVPASDPSLVVNAGSLAPHYSVR